MVDFFFISLLGKGVFYIKSMEIGIIEGVIAIILQRYKVHFDF